MKSIKIILTSLLISVYGCADKYKGNTVVIASASPSSSPSLSVNPSPDQKGIKLKLETSPDLYAPTMSSTVGILINPVYEKIQDYKVTFQTNNGFFLSWNNEVKNLGKELTYDNNKVYWSYTGSEKFKSADITVSVFNKSNNTLVDSSLVKINIDDNGMASVVSKI